MYGEKNALDKANNLWTEISQLIPYIKDTKDIVRKYINNGKRILIEGAQGMFLDIDYGQYPFVTSSCTTPSGATLGTGVGVKDVDEIIGVTKAYSTYVGNGAYIAEANAVDAEVIRNNGNEYGTTAGRPRRCGWLDMNMLRSSVIYGSIDKIIITKLDVLEHFSIIRVVDHYLYKNSVLKTIPSNPNVLKKCTPSYKEFKSWKNIKQTLPQGNICLFLQYIENDLKKYNKNVKIEAISYGPERNEILFL